MSLNFRGSTIETYKNLKTPLRFYDKTSGLQESIILVKEKPDNAVLKAKIGDQIYYAKSINKTVKKAEATRYYKNFAQANFYFISIHEVFTDGTERKQEWLLNPDARTLTKMNGFRHAHILNNQELSDYWFTDDGLLIKKEVYGVSSCLRVEDLPGVGTPSTSISGISYVDGDCGSDDSSGDCDWDDETEDVSSSNDVPTIDSGSADDSPSYSSTGYSSYDSDTDTISFVSTGTDSDGNQVVTVTTVDGSDLGGGDKTDLTCHTNDNGTVTISNSDGTSVTVEIGSKADEDCDCSDCYCNDCFCNYCNDCTSAEEEYLTGNCDDDCDCSNVICTYITGELFDGEVLKKMKEASKENVHLAMKNGMSLKAFREYYSGVGLEIVEKLKKEKKEYYQQLWDNRISIIWDYLRNDTKKGLEMYINFTFDLVDKYSISLEKYPALKKMYDDRRK